MPKVFVTQEVMGRDLSQALKFGNIKVLLPPGDYNHSTPHLAEKVITGIQDMTIEDWILLMGDPTVIALTGALVWEKLGVLNMLKWDKFKNDYIVIKYEERSHVERYNAD